MRNALAHVAKGQRDIVAAAIRTAFVQEDHESAVAQWRQAADSLRPRFEKLAELMDEAEHDVLAFMTFPKDHRTKIHSTNPLEEATLGFNLLRFKINTLAFRRPNELVALRSSFWTAR